MRTIKNGIKNVEDFLNKKGSKDDFIKKLIEGKEPKRTEIEVSFFQYCNLKCSFCWQDTSDETGTNTIREKANSVIEYISSYNDIKDEVYLAMTGGELFLDSIDRSSDYFYFVDKVNNAFKQIHPNKKITFTFITNLSFSNQERIRDLLKSLTDKDIKIGLGTSWDISGRPLRMDLSSQFHKNLLYFKSNIYGITFVATSTSIKRLLTSDLSYFDFLYDNFVVDFDYYVPTDKSEALMPSDEELLSFFMFIFKNYPETGLMKAWRSKEKNTTSCNSLNKITILPDGSLTTCRQLDYKEDEFKTKISNESNKEIIYSFIEKNSCLTCEYYERCTFSCFVMNDHKSYKKKLDDCVYRIMFKGIDNE